MASDNPHHLQIVIAALVMICIYSGTRY